MKKLRHYLDSATLFVLRNSLADKIVGYLSYARRRIIRRRVEARLYASGVYGDEVMDGPFKGLRYPPLSSWASCRFEKITGSYEHELHGLVRRIVSDKTYDLIVNVGAAEGFYTAGLARLFKNARIISYEPGEQASRFCEELCRINQVADRVEQRGRCSAEELAALHPEGKVLVWMDIDTGERAVLDPDKVPWLRRADILVELHDCLEPGLNKLIRQRFQASHHIEQFTTAGFEYARIPMLRDLLFTEIDSLVGEDRRGLQDWYFMEPLTSGSQV